jgi:hypothetical protein
MHMYFYHGLLCTCTSMMACYVCVLLYNAAQLFEIAGREIALYSLIKQR